MNKFLKALLLVGITLSPSVAFAQSTAAETITGYLTTSGCPSGQTVCFRQFGPGSLQAQQVIAANISSPGSPTTAASTVPADVFTVVGGIAGVPAALTVTDTQLVSVTGIQTPGTSCTNGAGKTLTGTTGTGTKFHVSATASGNAIVSVQSVTLAGDYTVNPTDLTAEPVTGDSCSGTKLAIAIGALTATVSTAGNYQIAPISPVSITSSGLDSTSTWNLSWDPAP